MLDIFYYINIGFFLNLLYFKFLNYIIENDKNKILKVNIFLSLLHSVLGSGITITYFLNDYDLLGYFRVFSIGYLLLDFICINSYKELEQGRIVYNIHHFIFLSYWYFIDTDRYVSHRILICEYSTILMNLRFLSKFYYPKYVNIFGLGMFIMFFFVRIVNIIDLYFLNSIVIKNHFKLYGSYIILQFYWFGLMLIKFYNFINSNEKLIKNNT